MEDLPFDSEFEEAPASDYALVASICQGVGCRGSLGAVVACISWAADFGARFSPVVAGIFWAADFVVGSVTVVTGFGGYCMVLLPPLFSYD